MSLALSRGVVAITLGVYFVLTTELELLTMAAFALIVVGLAELAAGASALISPRSRLSTHAQRVAELERGNDVLDRELEALGVSRVGVLGFGTNPPPAPKKPATPTYADGYDPDRVPAGWDPPSWRRYCREVVPFRNGLAGRRFNSRRESKRNPDGRACFDCRRFINRGETMIEERYALDRGGSRTEFLCTDCGRWRDVQAAMNDHAAAIAGVYRVPNVADAERLARELRTNERAFVTLPAGYQLWQAELLRSGVPVIKLPDDA